MIVRVTCPGCGTVSLDLSAVTVVLVANTPTAHAAFACPLCAKRAASSPLSLYDVWRLSRAGAVVQVWRPPVPSARPAAVEAIGEDDLIAFGLAVRDLCAEDVLAECGGD